MGAANSFPAGTFDGKLDLFRIMYDSCELADCMPVMVKELEDQGTTFRILTILMISKDRDY